MRLPKQTFLALIAPLAFWLAALMAAVSTAFANDAAEVRRLAARAEEFRRCNQLDSAQLVAEQCKTLAEASGDKQGLGLYWQAMGRIEAAKGNYAASLAALSNALKLFQDLSDSLSIAKTFNALGRTYYQGGQMLEAFDALARALDLAERLGDKQVIATSLTNIGNLYLAERNYAEAIAHYQKAKPLFEELGDKQFVGFTLNNIGNAYQEQGKYEEAMTYHQRSLEVKLEQKDERGISAAYNNIGYLYFLQAKYDDALDFYVKSLALREKLNLRYEQSQSFYNIAYACFKRDSLLLSTRSDKLAPLREPAFEQALLYAERARTLASELSAKEHVKNASELLSKIYALQNRPADALAAYKDYIAARDSMFSEASVKTMNELKARYESERKEKEIALLQKDAENQALVRNALIGGVLLFGALLVLAASRYQLKLRSEAALQRQNLALDQTLKELQAQRNIAEEASRVKSEILNVVAHDLQTPISSVINFAYLLQQSPALTQRQTDMLGRIEQISQAMLRQTVNLLNAASEKTVGDLRREQVNLSELLCEVATQSNAARKNQRIELCVEPNVMVEGDADKLREVFENLVGNAVKYSPRGTKIRVSAEKREMASARGLEARPSILVAVQDEGQGLSEEDKANLFGKFQRLSAKPTAGESSTGLGLYIAKQIIERHGGSIWAESEGQGKGATFFAQLPMRR